MTLRLILFLILFVSSFLACLKAKKSPFDASKPSTSAGLAIVAGLNSSNSNSTSSSVPPSNISYGSTNTFKMIPGVAVSYTPTVTGAVDSWSITPTLPTGLNFDTKTGTISGTPSSSAYPNGFPLTTFTITAKNGNAQKEFTIQLEILKSGDNVWTVISGVSGQDVGVNAGSLIINDVSNSTHLYVSGSVIGNMDGITSPAPGNVATFISKYSLEGALSWTKMLGVAGGTTYSQGTRVDGSGNIYLSGVTTGNLDGNTITGSDNLFVSKYNSSGTKQWTKIRGNNATIGNAVAIDGSGNSYATGYKNGSSLDSFSHPNGNNSLIIVKHDTNGNWLDTNGLGSAVGGYGIEGYGIAISPNSNIVVAGMTKTTTRCATTNALQSAAVFIFNSSMVFSSCGSVTHTGGFAFGIAIDSSNNIYITGYFTSSSIDGLPKNSTGANYDAFLIKFDYNGAKQWTRVYGVSGATNTKAYAVTISGTDLFITGETSGNLNGETLNGTKDMFIIKYDLNTDTVKWTRLIGSAGNSTNGVGIAFDSQKTMYGTGVTNGDIGSVTNPTKPNYSMFITRFVQ